VNIAAIAIFVLISVLNYSFDKVSVVLISFNKVVFASVSCKEVKHFFREKPDGR